MFKPGDQVIFKFSGQGLKAELHHDGQVVTVVEQIDPASYDFHEVGAMFEIRAADGWTCQAFEDELSAACHPLNRLKHHVTGAIERGEAKPIVELRDYSVTWGINIRASSFEDAARQALTIQRNPESIATVFDVVRDDAVSMNIDLGEE